MPKSGKLIYNETLGQVMNVKIYSGDRKLRIGRESVIVFDCF